MSDPEVFEASRLTSGNLIFPTRIVVSPNAVMRRKRSWFKLNEESINIRNVASVNITTGILWAEIRIESSGGTDPLTSHGHSKQDARRIKELIETLQSHIGSGMAAGEGSAPGELISCPFCAEKIRKAARVCRFCGRDLA